MTDFPTDAERQVAYARCIDEMRPHHRHLPGEDITCACSDEHTDDVLAALAPLIRAREAAAWDAGAEAAWDAGFDAGYQYARAVNPEWPDMPTNPFEGADDARD